MFKGLSGWILRMVCSVVLVSSLTIFVTWNMMELYMGRLFSQFNLSEDEKNVEFGELLAKLTQQGDSRSTVRESSESLSSIERITQARPDPIVQKDLGDQDANSPSGNRDGDTEDTAGHLMDGDQPADHEYSGGQTTTENGNEVSTTEDTERADTGTGDETGQQPDDAVPVFGDGLTERADLSEQFVMSGEEFAMKQDQLSEEDKITIFTILFNKVPQHEFQNLSVLLEEGITADEVAQIYEILDEYLEEEEMTQLANIIQKYE